MKILAMEKRKDKTACFQMSITILSSSAHASLIVLLCSFRFTIYKTRKSLFCFTHTSTWKFEFKAR